MEDLFKTRFQKTVLKITKSERRQRAAGKVVSINFEREAVACLNYSGVYETCGFTYRNVFNMEYRDQLLLDTNISQEAKTAIINGRFLRNLNRVRNQLKQACSDPGYYKWIWITRGHYESFDTTEKSRLDTYCSNLRRRGVTFAERTYNTLIKRLVSDLKKSGVSTEEIEKAVAALRNHDFFAIK